METWEVVLILTLLTISTIVVSKHKVPVEVIAILDNTVVQIVLLGLTLLASISSPAVAVVAVTTLVVVYYMRNVVKIQMVMQNSASSAPMPSRVAVIEERTTTVVSEDEHSQSPEARTIEYALRGANPSSRENIIGTQTTPGQVSYSDRALKPYAVFGGSQQGQNVEPFESQAPFISRAQASPIDKVMPSIIDSNIFGKSPVVPVEANESTTIANQMRFYSEGKGQYNIDEPRPFTVPDKYEEADYSPDESTLSNNFTPIGASIDDKITNMSRGKMFAGVAPQDYNKAVPGRR